MQQINKLICKSEKSKNKAKFCFWLCNSIHCKIENLICVQTFYQGKYQGLAVKGKESMETMVGGNFMTGYN